MNADSQIYDGHWLLAVEEEIGHNQSFCRTNESMQKSKIMRNSNSK